VRLTDDEHAELADAAAALDQDCSAFVREAIAEAIADFRECSNAGRRTERTIRNVAAMIRPFRPDRT
jgi:hypothetical protein